MQTYAAISTTVIGSVAIAISVANTTKSWGWGLLAGIATALATFAGWRIALGVQARQRRRSDKQQERDLSEAVVLGAPIHVEPCLHVFGTTGTCDWGPRRGMIPSSTSAPHFAMRQAVLRRHTYGCSRSHNQWTKSTSTSVCRRRLRRKNGSDVWTGPATDVR